MNDETRTRMNPQLAQLGSFLTYRISRVHQKLNAQASRILAGSVGVTLNQWRIDRVYRRGRNGHRVGIGEIYRDG